VEAVGDGGGRRGAKRALPFSGRADRRQAGAEPARRPPRSQRVAGQHRFEPTALVGIYRWHYAPQDVTFLRFCFRGRVEGVENRPLDREIAALHWLSREELAARRADHRSPLVQRCVDDYIAGRQFPLEVFSSEYA
jgi:hypothetical protein